MTRAHLRQSVLAILLAFSLSAAWWIHRQEDAPNNDFYAPSVPASRQESAAASPSTVVVSDAMPAASADDTAPVTLNLKRLHARDLAGTDIDPFRTKSWFVPPPPPPPEPPPKPTAPPLPFLFVGKTEEVGSKPAIYLSNGNEFYTVLVGDKFAGSYQLERIDRGVLMIRYLPLSIVQTLPIGNSE